jgi:hypothetical protein
MTKYTVTIEVETEDVGLREAVENGNYQFVSVNGVSVEGAPIGCVICSEVGKCYDLSESCDFDETLVARTVAIRDAIVAAGGAVRGCSN